MIVALIPARSGSKRVKDKNIHPLGGYPLMAWSIACAKMCGLDAYVTSESVDYLELAARYDAHTYFRKFGYGDNDGDMHYIADFYYSLIDWDVKPDIVLLRPTTPLREPSQINSLILRYTHKWHHIAMCKLRDSDLYRNTGYCEIFPIQEWGMNKVGFVLECEVGEIDTEEDFDYVEWRLQKYGSPIHDYLKANYPNPE